MYADPRLGETTAIGCDWSEKWTGADFTIESATITITNNSTGAAIVTDAAASVDDTKTFYRTTFSAANGYAVDTVYRAVITANISIGGTTYVEKHEDWFTVRSG